MFHTHILQVPSRTADIKPDMEEAEGKPARECGTFSDNLGYHLHKLETAQSHKWLMV